MWLCLWLNLKRFLWFNKDANIMFVKRIHNVKDKKYYCYK